MFSNSYYFKISLKFALIFGYIYGKNEGPYKSA